MAYDTFTSTHSQTTTITNVRHIVVKIGTDLKRMQRFHDGRPTDATIADYEKEAVALLHGGYLNWVEYGFHRNGNWIAALRYTARDNSALMPDNNPGRVPAGVYTGDCSFNSVLSYTAKWARLTYEQQERIYANAGISLRRTTSGCYHGNWREDRAYSSGGTGVSRSSVG